MKQEREVRNLALNLYHSQFGKPDDTKKGYDYELLIEMIREINKNRNLGKYTGDLFDLKDY